MDNCTKCGNPKIIIKRKQSGQALCKDCFIKSIQKKVINTIKKENLLEKEDKVLLALSGGKDSVSLLDILDIFRKRNIINICAVTIDEGISGYRQKGVDIAVRHAERLGIEHKVVSFEDYFDITLDEIMKVPDHRLPCTYCGVFRRWLINRATRDFGATKIATGHNLDDETQSILMNYLDGNVGNLVKIGPKTESKSPLFTPKIKPLREIPEKEVGLYALARDLKVHFAGCPYSQESFRGEIGEIIKELSKNHPTIMYSTLHGFDKIKNALKKENKNNFKFERCSICAEPSSNEICRVCTFLNEFDKKVIL